VTWKLKKDQNLLPVSQKEHPYYKLIRFCFFSDSSKSQNHPRFLAWIPTAPIFDVTTWVKKLCSKAYTSTLLHALRLFRSLHCRCQVSSMWKRTWRIIPGARTNEQHLDRHRIAELWTECVWRKKCEWTGRMSAGGKRMLPTSRVK
jgi:hypothetical protein